MKSCSIMCAYNEAPKPNFISYLVESVISTLACLREGLLENAIFVNDGSTDKTEEVIWKLIRDIPNTKLVSYQENLGKAKAFLRGLEESAKYNPDVIVTLDADMKNFGREHFYFLIEPILRGTAHMTRGIYKEDDGFSMHQPRYSGLRAIKFESLWALLEIGNDWRSIFDYLFPNEGYRLENVLETIILSHQKQEVELPQLVLREMGKGSYDISEIWRGMNSL